MKIEVRLTEGKNIIDLALQHYGDAVAGIDLLMNDNPGITPNSAFQAGEVIIIDEDKAANRAVRDYFAQRRISVNTGDVPVPATPTLLMAVTGAGLGEIDLSWQDNATDEDSYELWRSTAPDSGFVVIATLPADTTTYADTGLANTTTYYYRLRARNAFASSPFTAVVSANTIGWVLRVAASNPSVLSFTKTGAPATYISAGGITEVFFTDAISTATEFIADDESDPDNNAGITGVLNLAAFTGLRTVRARNQSFDFVPGTWVRNANVVINLSNSLVTAQRLKDVVNSIIIANGGTTTDNGTEYTGVAGETHANRQLIIGYIELDLTAPENIITFQKVVALQSVGWTITTIKTLCLKSFAVDTVDTFFAVTSLEKTRRLFGLDYVSGAPLDIDLYETLPNASAGGSTGRLAQSYAGVNTWLLNDTNYNAWAEGDDNSKALRFFAADTLSTGNRSNLRYQAFPTATRACGAVQDVLGLNAFLAYSTRKVLQSGYTGDFFVSNNGANVTGNLLTWFNQVQSTGSSGDLNNGSTTPFQVLSEGILRPATSSTIFRRTPFPSAFNLNLSKYTAVVRSRLLVNNTASGILFLIAETDTLSGEGKRVAFRYSSGLLQILIVQPSVLVIKQYAVPLNTFQVFAMVVDNGNVFVYIDNVFIETFFDTRFIMPVTRVLRTGANDVQLANYEKSELIFYQDALDAAQVKSVTNFLNL
jgi:hypothetical protein